MSEITLAAPEARWRAYAQLAKLSFFDYYLSALVVWTLLPWGLREQWRTVWLLAVLTAGWVGVCAASVTFDDVSGFRDGSDHVNYDPAQQLRRRELKPLLDGRLTERQAVRFGYGALGFGLVWLGAAVLGAPHRPLWALLLLPFLVAISVQYSYGLRLSYRYGQELVLLLSTGLVVLIPVGLTSGRLTGLGALEAYLFGAWSLLVSLYSNIKDIEGDRAAGRRNLAVALSPRAYRAAVALVSLGETAAVPVALGVAHVAWWFGLFLLPVLALRVRQLHAGLIRGDVLVARKLGGQAHRLGVVLLLIANLIVVR